MIVKKQKEKSRLDKAVDGIGEMIAYRRRQLENWLHAAEYREKHSNLVFRCQQAMEANPKFPIFHHH